MLWCISQSGLHDIWQWEKQTPSQIFWRGWCLTAMQVGLKYLHILTRLDWFKTKTNYSTATAYPYERLKALTYSLFWAGDGDTESPSVVFQGFITTTLRHISAEISYLHEWKHFSLILLPDVRGEVLSPRSSAAYRKWMAVPCASTAGCCLLWQRVRRPSTYFTVRGENISPRTVKPFC